MTRRDIIIIAVLANIGVLSLLFVLAFRSEEEKVADQSEIAFTIVEEPSTSPQSPVEVELIKTEPSDEVDALLEEIAPISPTISASTEEDSIQFLDSEAAVVPPKETEDGQTVEITVKSGDALEKIARANGTTVEAIMKINNLKSDRLKIGQVLQVPVGAKKKTATTKKSAPKPVAEADIQYYIMKNGDNPWKIAKQFHIKLDELLKLNNLDEESARKLKPGDQLRVH